MRFARPARRTMPESIVPMINVVFLLLIFFMMSATISAAPPFDLTLPRTEEADEIAGDDTLYLSADGTAAYQTALGDDAWAALAAMQGEGALILRADAALSATTLAQVLGRLAQMGRSEVELVIRAP